jgi:ABC-type transport system involved in multi-copper enzyme maturation permease subunit
MNSTLEIMRFTTLEIMRMRVFHLLIAGAILLPVAALVFSNLFMLDIAKVQADVLIAGARILASVYILFVVVTLLGRDIGQKVCHLFLAPPLSRFSYLTGRFLGLLIGLLLLMIVVMLTSESSLLLTLNPDGEIGRNALPWHTGFSLAGFTFYQHVSLLAAVFLICTWATGLAEMLLFSVAVLFITWIVPPIILALQSPEVVSQFPAAVAALVEAIGMILPQLNGGNIGLALAHGLPISFSDILWHLLEHTAYGVMMFGLALFIFSRRDL